MLHYVLNKLVLIKLMESDDYCSGNLCGDNGNEYREDIKIGDVPNLTDSCEKCYSEAKRKRRYSTSVPSYNLCESNCGYAVYEIHQLCLKCATKENKCPWCGRSPWEKVQGKKNY
jgi:hypothetical protein